MRLKHYIAESNESAIFTLMEKMGQVRKLYLKTGKINQKDYTNIERALGAYALKHDYSEWLTRTLIFMNAVKGRNSYLVDDVVKTVIFPYDLVARRGFNVPLPEKETLLKLNQFIVKAEEKVYKKMKINQGEAREGIDYEAVYHVGRLEIFRIKTRNAMVEIGRGTKWCVSSCDSDSEWRDYVGSQDMRFYVVRDHSRNSSDPFYKVAVRVEKSGARDYWDALDRSYTGFSNEKQIIVDAYDYPWFKDADVGTPTFDEIMGSNRSFDELASDELDEVRNTIMLYINDESSGDINLPKTAKFTDSGLSIKINRNKLDELEDLRIFYDVNGFVKFEEFIAILNGTYEYKRDGINVLNAPGELFYPETMNMVKDMMETIDSDIARLGPWQMYQTHPAEMEPIKIAVEGAFKKAWKQDGLQDLMNEVDQALENSGFDSDDPYITLDVKVEESDSELEFMFHIAATREILPFDFMIHFSEVLSSYGNVDEDMFNDELVKALKKIKV